MASKRSLLASSVSKRRGSIPCSFIFPLHDDSTSTFHLLGLPIDSIVRMKQQLSSVRWLIGSIAAQQINPFRAVAKHRHAKNAR